MCGFVQLYMTFKWTPGTPDVKGLRNLSETIKTFSMYCKKCEKVGNCVVIGKTALKNSKRFGMT